MNVTVEMVTRSINEIHTQIIHKLKKQRHAVIVFGLKSPCAFRLRTNEPSVSYDLVAQPNKCIFFPTAISPNDMTLTQITLFLYVSLLLLLGHVS